MNKIFLRKQLKCVIVNRPLSACGRHTSAFSKSKRGPFTQAEAKLTNQYKEDAYLREHLALTLPNECLKQIEPDLIEFGEKVATTINDLGVECEQIKPYVEHYDAWGNRIDKLVTCNAWNQLKRVSAEEGLIAIPYEKKFGEFSRVYQITKLYMFMPSSGLYGCPLAMTDGAAKTIQTVGITNHTKNAFARLTSRDPKQFWTSGQWMTEKKGGSDVAGGTETVAIQQGPDPDLFALCGYKWFSSATDADMSITLARIQDKNGEVIQGTKGLTMFYLELRDESSKLNGIEIHKLKNKLGTRQLPTAELLLDGTKAYKISKPGNGVSSMSSMLNITRVHNSLAAVGYMRRIINLSRDYATKRVAFGNLLNKYPLHVHTLANMEVECRASLNVLMHVALLLGKSEVNTANEEELHLLRLLTPLTKLYTAKQAIAVSSEGLENFGGQGYIEDTGLPTIFRDSQVLSIWEGTTNVLSLDVLRCIEKSKGDVIKAYCAHIKRTCEKASSSNELRPYAEAIVKNSNDLAKFMHTNQHLLLKCAREFSSSLYRVFCANQLVDKCVQTKCKPQDLYTLKKWCVQDLVPVLTFNNKQIYDDNSYKNDLSIVYPGHPSWKK